MIEGIISSLIAAAIGWVAAGFYGKKKNSLFRFVRRFKAYNSGLQGYYYSFPPEENEKTWQYIKNEFCYLGVSAATIINELTDFMKTEDGRRIQYNFLLIDPKNEDFILKQEAYKSGYKEQDISSLDTTKKEKLYKDVEITRNNIILAVERLKNTECKVHVKFFKEFLPWWMYVFDENRIFVGLLEFNKDGRKSPLVILKKNKEHFTLYDAFETNWRRLWESAIDA